MAIGPGQVNVIDDLNAPGVSSFVVSYMPAGATKAVVADFHVGIWAEEGHEASYVYFDTFYFFARDDAGGEVFVCTWPNDKPVPPQLFTASDGMQILVYSDAASNCLVSDYGTILIVPTGFSIGHRVNLLTVPKNGYLSPSRITKSHNGLWIVPFAAGAYPELHSSSFEFHYHNNELFYTITPDGTRFEAEHYTQGFHVMGDQLDVAGNVVGNNSLFCLTIDVETAEYLAAMAVATSGYDGGDLKLLEHQFVGTDCSGAIKPYKATYQR